MDGVLFVDKPQGMTSRDVVNQVSKVFHTKKVGHTGTLDPLATGVLVICVGKYTKLVESFMSNEKTYVAKMKLGIQTDTGDITGNKVKEDKKKFTKEEIEQVFQNFPKEYDQKVPLYSAVKIQGKKLYEYAREGKNVELPRRKVQIKELEIINILGDEIEFKTTVSKGTYIRSFIEDLATSLKTVATMSSLRRVRQGNIAIEKCVELKDIKEDMKLESVEDLFDYPKYIINDREYHKVKNGNALALDSLEKRVFLVYQENVVAIYEKKNEEYRIVFSLIS